MNAIAIYPREGTETTLIQSILIPPILQFIPARGRKLAHCNLTANLVIAIYPREGTETPSGNRVLQCNPIAIYPREGTETMTTA